MLIATSLNISDINFKLQIFLSVISPYCLHQWLDARLIAGLQDILKYQIDAILLGTSTTQVSIRIWNFITFLDRVVFPKCYWRRPIFSCRSFDWKQLLLRALHSFSIVIDSSACLSNQNIIHQHLVLASAECRSLRVTTFRLTSFDTKKKKVRKNSTVNRDKCLVGAFAKFRKTTISFVMAVCPFVRPHGANRLPLDGVS